MANISGREIEKAILGTGNTEATEEVESGVAGFVGRVAASYRRYLAAAAQKEQAEAWNAQKLWLFQQRYIPVASMVLEALQSTWGSTLLKPPQRAEELCLGFYGKPCPIQRLKNGRIIFLYSCWQRVPSSMAVPPETIEAILNAELAKICSRQWAGCPLRVKVRVNPKTLQTWLWVYQ